MIHLVLPSFVANTAHIMGLFTLPRQIPYASMSFIRTKKIFPETKKLKDWSTFCDFKYCKVSPEKVGISRTVLPNSPKSSISQVILSQSIGWPLTIRASVGKLIGVVPSIISKSSYANRLTEVNSPTSKNKIFFITEYFMCVHINLRSSPVRHRPPRHEHPASTKLSAGSHSSRCDEKS